MRSAADRALDVAELAGFEDPKKLSGGNTKVRWGFDAFSHIFSKNVVFLYYFF